MHIFLTGASGFVGGAFTRELSPGHTLLAMSRSAKSDGSHSRTLRAWFRASERSGWSRCNHTLRRLREPMRSPR
jgi:nucleoside-diphosphate-sugar epimerase